MPPDITTYYKNKVVKTVVLTPKQTSRSVVQNKGQRIDPPVYDLLIYDQWVNIFFSTEGALSVENLKTKQNRK